MRAEKAKFEEKMKTDMEIILERMKAAFWFIFTAICSVLSPVKNVLIVLLVAFVFNIFMGIAAKVGVGKQKFSAKKAFNAIVQLTFFFACAAFVHHSAFLLGDENIGHIGIKWLTYIVVYFYLTNIFKNAQAIFPKSNAVKFIYELLSTEVFGRLKKMLGYGLNDNINDDDKK